MSLRDARLAIVAAGQALYAEGLVLGTAGNLSVRGTAPGTMLVTPTNLAYDEMTPDDLVVITYDGDPVDGERLPSSESLLHGAIYRARPDVHAVVHAHPLYASVCAVRHETIPALLDEQVVYVGGPIEVSSYASPGTDELAANAVVGLGTRAAVLLANHGCVTVGRTPDEALAITRLVERIAHIWVLASARPGAYSLDDAIVRDEMALYEMLRQSKELDAT